MRQQYSIWFFCAGCIEFQMVFHMVFDLYFSRSLNLTSNWVFTFHFTWYFTSIFTGILPYLLHPISHIFNVVFHMPYREIPSENAEPISQGFHMIILTWYFTFLWNNVWKTMWNPCEIFTWFSHGLHILFTGLLPVVSFVILSWIDCYQVHKSRGSYQDVSSSNPPRLT